MRKRICALTMTLILTLLTACGGGQGDQAEERLQEIRGKYIGMTQCSGHLELLADYGERIFTFGVDLSWSGTEGTTLVITSPENISGTQVHIGAKETALEFDGVLVETGPLDREGLSPIDAVPALLSYAREGFVGECVLEDWDGAQRLHVTCREPEAEPGTGREGQLWFEADTGTLLRGEISVDGVTVIQCDVSGFTMEPSAAE